MRTAGVLGMLVVLLLAACGAPPPAAPTALVGDWNGTIEVPGQPLQFGARFAPDGTGGIDIPAQGATGIAATDVTVTGNDVRFGLAGIPGDPTFAGTLAPDGGSVSGDFTQGGQKLRFTMARGPLAAPARPQEPKPPFPYRSTDVTFPGRAGTVAGTLTRPEGPGPFPAVVMITGSGPQDRDETIAGHKPFLLVADMLTRAGFAVLRTDDRGVGGTGGDLMQATYPDLVGDTLAGVDFLRARPDIDPQRLGLLGHSEGGYLAPLVAQAAPEKVRFVVLLAGPAVPGEDVLLEQNRLIYAQRGAPQQVIDAQLTYLRELAALLRAGDVEGARERTRRAITDELDAAGVPQDQRPTPAQLDEQAAAVTSPVFAAFLAYDPGPALRALRVPVLALFGEKDLQVPPAQSEPALAAALAGHPDTTIRTLPGLNHLMQPTATGAVTEYGTIETTIDPQVLELVRSWVVARFG